MEQSSASSSNEPTTSTAPQPQIKCQGAQKKRKGSPPSSTVSLKKTKTIIDCKKAIAFFSELGLHKSFLNCGNVLAWNLDPNDPDFLQIQTYVYRGQRCIHDCKVVQALRIMTSLQNEGTLSSFNDDPSTKGQLRKMLWHGTSLQNIPKILQNGLKLPKDGRSRLFGDGIYFADVFANSLWYCYWRNSHQFDYDKNGSKVGYLFLCDVLLGNVHKVYFPKFNAPNLKQTWFGGKTDKVKSIQGCGMIIPDPQEDREIDGCVWPLGEKIMKPIFAYPLGLFGWNEYVVYERERVIPKFLVKVQINYKLPHIF